MTPPTPDARSRSRLLLVDDDDCNLVVLGALLENEFPVRTALSGPEALRALEREPAEVVITDQRMPAMTGVELLEQVKRRWPETVRIVLTAYADADAMIDAVNRGEVHRFVLKPWRPEEMRITVRQAAEWAEERRERVRLAAALHERNAALEAVLERAVRAERLAEVGRFAAETAHELGNLVQIASGVAGLLAGGSGRSPADLGGALGQCTDRMAEMTGAMRDLAGDIAGPFDPRPEDLAALVRETAALVRLLPAAAHRRIELELPSGLRLAADRRQLRQLLLNLLRNALEASRREIRVSARRLDAVVELAVEDDGPGIPAEHRQRIFEPFFSTKADGLGLGLSVCRRAAELHGGTLQAEEAPGGGARLVLRLPAP